MAPPKRRRTPSRVTVVHFPKNGSATAKGRSLATEPTVITTVPTRAEKVRKRAPYLLHQTGEDTPTLLNPMAQAESARSAPSGRAGRRGGAENTPVPERTVFKALSECRELLDAAFVKRGARRPTPEQISFISLTGHALFSRGHLDEARELFEAVVGLNVKDSFPHTMLGTLYLALGDGERALALFEEALRLDSSDLAARVYRGEIRLHGGKTSEGRRDLEWATRHGSKEDPFVDRASRLLRMLEPSPRRRK